MKTAVSVPDDVYHAATQLAAARQTSRSAVFTEALREYLDRHRRDNLTQRIDQALLAATEDRDPLVVARGWAQLRKQDW